jgi:DNA-directed RNA polymerase specialized sigma24 family protein
MEKNPATTEHPHPASAFPLTHWTIIFEAGSADSRQAQAALAKLCELYRQPIVNWFGRHANRQEAEDLAHSFIAYLLDKQVLARLRERKGRFRFFLVTVMRRFLYAEWDKAAAQRRGGNAAIVPLAGNEAAQPAGTDGDPQFDSDLAAEIHARVMSKLEPPGDFVPYLFGKDPSPGWDEVAATLNTTSAALRKRVSRLRRAHWEGFRDQVAELVSPGDKADETRYLYELLFRNLA